jgi:hypothetical protein
MAHLKLIAVFGLGALTALVAFAAGSARAQDQVRPAGYFCFQASSLTDLTTKANTAAQRGWRMVEGIGQPGASVWCFEQR